MDYRPQKALLVDRPPTGDRWIHEIKLDGFRMGVLISRGGVRIISRRGIDYTGEFPEIVAAARQLKTKNSVIDGEIVVLDKSGVSRFQLLQQLGAGRTGLAFFAFDLPTLDGNDLTRAPLEQRKLALRKLVGRGKGVIRYTDHFVGDGPKVFANACALGAEGIVSKLRDAPYRPDARSSDWQKIKCVKRQEFVLGGFTEPSGSRVGVGSILVGYYERGALRFAGKVGTGTGWSAAFGLKLRRDLERIEIDGSPFDPPPPGWLGRNAHWVKPQKVVEVEFTEWTTDGRIRHPSLKGFRADNTPREVIREREVAASRTGSVKQDTSVDSRDSAMVFPRVGISRPDLAQLYSRIADWALPHVQNRPLTLVRATSAITRDDALRTQAKFVHHTERDQRFVPTAVPRKRIREQKKIGEYCYIDSRDALLAVVAAGVVEWHSWNARIDDVERPDRIIFDIDPGPGIDWTAVVQAARRLRALLAAKDLESWVKTTGGKGLHVVVPFRREHDWDAVFEFSRAMATRLTEKSPRYIIDFDKGARRDRILIDYKRNYRTSIAVAAFSTRATPQGSLSVPVRWDELGRLKGGGEWDVGNIEQRLKRLKADPWDGYWRTPQRLVLDSE